MSIADRVPVLQVLGRSAGGIARHVADISASLDAATFDVTVAGPTDLPVPMPGRFAELDIPDGPFGHRAAVSRLRRLTDDLNPAVVHAHGLRAGIDAGRAAGHRDALVVVTVHNLVHPAIAGRARASLYGLAEKLVIRHADLVLCVSRQIRDHLTSRSPDAAHKIEVLYLGVDDPPPARHDLRSLRDALVPDDGRLVVTASRLAPQKRLSTMLRAVADLSDTHLAVLGRGPQEGLLRKEAAALGIGDRVHFLGFRQDVIDHIRAADVFCLSSVWEGVPLAAQEAILVGTPVVATAVGGMPELVEDGRSGRLVDPGDVPALRDALSEVLGDPEIARRFATEARRTFRDRFSRDRMLARLTDIYQGVRG